MPAYTTFMEFVLPALHEFTNTWHNPVNQNWESLDDWLKELHDNLVGIGTGSTWALLRGDLDNLAARLAVSINDDGTIDIAASDDFTNMATSATRGQYAGPRERLDDNDSEIYVAGQPVPGDRFTPVPIAGPTAGFPHERIDAGIALRAADFGANTGRPVASPHIPWSPGLVLGGANPLITGNAVGRIRITADAPAAIFNIDGYLFRLREILDLDWNLLTPANDEYVWIFVERTGSGYNNANYRYSAPAGPAVAAKDLRKLQSGTGTGATSGSIFTATGATFNSAAFGKVKEGDVLFITSTAAAGEYVIDELDGVTPDTKLTIKGKFKAGVSGCDWYIWDPHHPNIGAVVTSSDVTDLPAYADGRVYIARAKHQAGGNPIDIVTFATGGVYDSGWVAVDASTDFPYDLIHNLGVAPTEVMVQFRENATANRVYPPIVRRVLVSTVDEANTTLDPGDTKFATMLVPSAHWHSSDTEVTIELVNAIVNPATPAALFTTAAAADVTIGEMRVIARR